MLNRSDGIPTPVLQNSDDLPELIADAIKVSHPVHLYGQPVVEEFSDQDWSILTQHLDDKLEAIKLAAMLNHLGPQIPARAIEQDGGYRVVAGPFKSKKETKLVAKRIKTSFDIDVTPVKPVQKTLMTDAKR